MYVVIVETNWIDDPVLLLKEDEDLVIFPSLKAVYELYHDHMLNPFPWHVLDLVVMEFVEIL